jgi:hypothetical protein
MYSDVEGLEPFPFPMSLISLITVHALSLAMSGFPPTDFPTVFTL